MLFYDVDTVDVGYNQQVAEVDNTMYHVIHNNYWLNLTLNKIVICVLYPYHLSAVFLQIAFSAHGRKRSTDFRPCGNHFNLFIFDR